MHDKPSRRSYLRHILQYLSRLDKTPLPWWLSLLISRGVETHSSITCRFPHFLCQAAPYILQTLPLSKHVYSMSAGSDVFDLASQEITTYHARFPKPLYRYKVLCHFGPNVVASNGAEWKKYRKITAPAFSEVLS
jgi:cytochrome P450